MEETTEMQGSTGKRNPTETAGAVDSNAAGGRRGPTWRGWVLSILVAILLSVTATLLLGGSSAFRTDRAAAGEGGCVSVSGAGAGRGCCPPAVAGK
ncbi:MAG: hypothetical protein ACM3OG_06605 [Actinomycetota bacterium]